MQIKNLLDRLLGFIQELTAFYAELSEELPENFLRVVVDNTREFSELKKMPRKLLTFRTTRRNANETLTSSPPNCGNQNKKKAAKLTLHRLKMTKWAF